MTANNTPTLVHGITIDPSGALDLDDGLCYQRSSPRVEMVHIAITNVAASITPKSSLFYKAKERIESKYHADGRHTPMISLDTENHLSLLPNQQHAALILSIKFRDGNILSYQLRAGSFASIRKLSYSQANEYLQGNCKDTRANRKIQTMLRGLQQLKQLYIQEKRMSLDQGSATRVKSNEYGSSSYQLVAFYMKLANILMSKLADQYNIPLIYRNHGAVKTTSGGNGEFHREVVYHSNSKRGKLRAMRAVYGSRGLGHYGLDAELYARMTSPLRRFEDLVNQQQLLAFASGDNLPWNEAQIRKFCLNIGLTQNSGQGRHMLRRLDQYMDTIESLQDLDKETFSVLIVLAIRRRFTRDMTNQVKREVARRMLQHQLDSKDYAILLLRSNQGWHTTRKSILGHVEKFPQLYQQVVASIAHLDEYQSIQYQESTDNYQHYVHAKVTFGKRVYLLPEYQGTTPKSALRLARKRLLRDIFYARVAA
ncbi:MAG: RNB domain-containing ribonuclease [Candidatus Peribacteria bacterium]|nr:MAG: RNB domain-containing ribonuclease [Candidatus Peribacteria bacterium]